MTGATKADSEMLQSYINLVEEQIEKETNPTRRQNAQVCLEYVRQHGYPAPGYRFLIHQGKMEVLTEDEAMERKEQLGTEVPGCLQVTFGLVCCWPFIPHTLFVILHLYLILLTRSSILLGG